MSDQGFKSQLTILQSYRDWNKVSPSSLAWSLNKVVFVGGVYVLDPSCASPTLMMLAH